MPDVPTLFELMDKEKTPARSRLLATVMLDGSGFGAYPIVAAPRVPAERIKILREAFGLTLKTPEFLEEAKKNKWEIRPVGGDELAALAKKLPNLQSEVIERLKSLLGTSWSNERMKRVSGKRSKRTVLSLRIVTAGPKQAAD